MLVSNISFNNCKAMYIDVDEEIDMINVSSELISNDSEFVNKDMEIEKNDNNEILYGHFGYANEDLPSEFVEHGRYNTPFEETRINPEYRDNDSTNVKYRCQACGWYGYPIYSQKRAEYWCRNCSRSAKELTEWLFKYYPSLEHIPAQKEVCPNEGAHGHRGFIHDTRVMSHMNNTGITASDLKCYSPATYCCWYCYDCKKHYPVDVKKIDESLGSNKSKLPYEYWYSYLKESKK